MRITYGIFEFLRRHLKNPRPKTSIQMDGTLNFGSFDLVREGVTFNPNNAR